jgi:hypothetical protein
MLVRVHLLCSAGCAGTIGGNVLVPKCPGELRLIPLVVDHHDLSMAAENDTFPLSRLRISTIWLTG